MVFLGKRHSLWLNFTYSPDDAIDGQHSKKYSQIVEQFQLLIKCSEHTPMGKKGKTIFANDNF